MTSSVEIRTAIRVLEEFKKIDPDITLPSMLVFLYAAEQDNKSGNQYGIDQRLDMSGATASRAIAHWLPFKRPRVKGHDMLDSIPDPEDRRFKIVTLNRRGLVFIEKIRLAVMEGWAEKP
jgi:DNA-binding MarR family transcriptional regulator